MGGEVQRLFHSLRATHTSYEGVWGRLPSRHSGPGSLRTPQDACTGDRTSVRRPVEPSSVRSSEDLSYAGGDGFAQLSVLAGVEVDAVYVAGDDDMAGVEELASLPLGEALVVPADLPGFLLSSIEHLCHVGESRDCGRGDPDHDGSAAIRPASAPQHHVGQACSPRRDVRGGASEARLEVVGPKHQRYKVEGTVRLETRHQVSPAVLVIPLYGIIPHRRPARQALFDHTIFLTQPQPEHPRPAYVLGKALPRLGVRAPGVRVPVTQYRSHLIPSRSEDTNSLSALSTGRVKIKVATH